MSAWNRVVDYRLGRLNEMTNVSLYLESTLGVDEIIDLAPDRVVLATGARWTNMLYSSMEIPVGRLDHPQVFTPDDIAAGRLPEGPTLVFDFDNYYMGGVLTEHLAAQGIAVSYATPAGQASAWTIMTNELPLVHRALSKRRVPVTTLHVLKSFDGETATLAHIFTGEESRVPCRSVLIVGLRLPRNELSRRLDGARRRGRRRRHPQRRPHRRRAGSGRDRPRRPQRTQAGARTRRCGAARPYRRDTPIVDAVPDFETRTAAE